jgi:hypothetical protein
MAMILDDVQVAEDIGKIYHHEDTDAVSTVSTIFTKSTHEQHSLTKRNIPQNIIKR